MKYKEPKDMTDNELLDNLEEYHTPTEIPPCRVCGGPLSIQSCGGGRPTTWACSGMEEDPDKPGHLIYKKGRHCADEHYGQSTFEDRKHDDPCILELVRRFRQLQDERDNYKRELEEIRTCNYCGQKLGRGHCPSCDNDE